MYVHDKIKMHVPELNLEIFFTPKTNKLLKTDHDNFH